MFNVDILENSILHDYPGVLEELLRDHTTGKNIFWATNDYEEFGKGYDFFSQITVSAITDENERIVRPRVLKSKENQTGRSKNMAEVFTPSWVCNAQINLVDHSWFGRKEVFNIESLDSRSWEATTVPINFPEGKTWKDYVRSTRIEITCGEAPYLVSRYDTTTGNYIPLHQRIGMLDRKLRVIGENTTNQEEWLNITREAYQNIYGYEWQGDSLFLARESLLITFLEYFSAKFENLPPMESIKDIANIISWNLWQMDGLKFVVPKSCGEKKTIREDLFGNKEVKIEPCLGCQKDDAYAHNGIYCQIMNWVTGEPIEFVSLLKKQNNECK